MGNTKRTQKNISCRLTTSCRDGCRGRYLGACSADGADKLVAEGLAVIQLHAAAGVGVHVAATNGRHSHPHHYVLSQGSGITG